MKLLSTEFVSNTAEEEGSAIIALQCEEDHYKVSRACLPHSSLPVAIVRGLFKYNLVHQLTYKSSTVAVNSIKSLHLESTIFLSNVGSAILANNNCCRRKSL